MSGVPVPLRPPLLLIVHYLQRTFPWPENVPVALLMAGSSMLTEVGNGRCFFLMLDEEWWGPLVLELWCDGVPWLQSESYVGLCWKLGSRPPVGWSGEWWVLLLDARRGVVGSACAGTVV